MENLLMCRICLATNVRLCSIASHLRDMYERITGMTFKREDSRPLVACYICHARLQSCYRLRTSCLRSEDLLTEMMSNSELIPEDVLSTNTLSIVSVLQLSLGHALQDSTECHIKEEDSEIIHDAELDKHIAEDIKIEPQDENNAQLDDYNQCSHLDDPLDVINREADIVDTDDEDIKLGIEDTILKENDPNFADSYSQLADKICPKIVKIVLQRIDVNDSTTGVRVSKKSKIAALEDIEGATTNKRKIEVEIKEETENITMREPKIITKKKKVEKPVTARKILESSEKLEIKLSKCENIVTSVLKNAFEDKSTNNTSLEYNVSSISISKNKGFICDTCKKGFSKKGNLIIHIRTHTGEKPFICNLCKKGFNRKIILKDHIRTHAGEKPFICNVCKKCFNRKNILNNHIVTHSGEKPFICHVCKKGFTQKINLKNHIRTHTGEKPFICHVCKKGFTQKSNLKSHIRTHTGEKPFICTVCKKGFTQETNLKKHIRTHTGEKPFMCIVCKKRFSIKSHLNIHIRSHTGEKPFICNICKKCFSVKGTLRRHMVTHTGEKPFICNVCKKCYSEKGSLSRHIRIHTGEKPYIK